MIKKEQRIIIWNKFDKKCAYCGCSLEYSKMQVDHVIPLYRNDTDETLQKWGIKRGMDNIDNYFPSCARCNHWKSTFTVEKFRDQINKQIDQLKKNSSQFRMSLDFNLIKETNNNVVFWFEKY
jgi:5-methylcytosine-specific restriction endonuclease McrA